MGSLHTIRQAKSWNRFFFLSVRRKLSSLVILKLSFYCLWLYDNWLVSNRSLFVSWVGIKSLFLRRLDWSIEFSRSRHFLWSKYFKTPFSLLIHLYLSITNHLLKYRPLKYYCNWEHLFCGVLTSTISGITYPYFEYFHHK